MDKLIKKFKESSLLVKALLLIPIALIAVMYGLPSILNNEEKKRQKTDSSDKRLRGEIAKADREAASHEGAISTLEKEKAEQLAKLDSEDPTSFHNRRPR